MGRWPWLEIVWRSANYSTNIRHIAQCSWAYDFVMYILGMYLERKLHLLWEGRQHANSQVYPEAQLQDIYQLRNKISWLQLFWGEKTPQLLRAARLRFNVTATAAKHRFVSDNFMSVQRCADTLFVVSSLHLTPGLQCPSPTMKCKCLLIARRTLKIKPQRSIPTPGEPPGNWMTRNVTNVSGKFPLLGLFCLNKSFLMESTASSLCRGLSDDSGSQVYTDFSHFCRHTLARTHTYRHYLLEMCVDCSWGDRPKTWFFFSPLGILIIFRSL